MDIKMNIPDEEDKYLDEVFPTRKRQNQTIHIKKDLEFDDVNQLEEYCRSLVEDENGDVLDLVDTEEVNRIKNTLSDMCLDGTISLEDYDELMSILS